MKKAISLVLVAMLVLALGGCASEGQELYEKYAPIIDMLEAKDYQGAIRDITAMAIEEQRGEVEKVPTMQVLCDTWYTKYEGAPTQLTFKEDGTCTIGNESMTWLAEESHSDTYLRLQLSKDGNICRIVTLETSYQVPYLSMYFAEERDNGIYGGESIGTYYNHPIMPYVLRSWYDINSFEMVGEIEGFSLGTDSASVNDDSCTMKLINSSDDSFLEFHIDGKNEREGSYTVKMTMRDGHAVAQFTDDVTGETGLYYNGSHSGYEKTWPEVIYDEAMDNYDNYLEYGNFYCDISEEYYYDSDDNAISYLYDQFAAMGDYADADEILANWDVVKYSRAMRYLTTFENRNSFYIGETYYGWNRETLDFIKGLFEEISGYSEAADVLNNWDAVLYNRAMYYLNQYLKGHSFYIGDDYYGGGSAAALSYAYSQFAEIADYSEAQAILNRFTILENVYLSYNYTNLDHMGNVYESSQYNSGHEYNEQGQLIHLENSTELRNHYGEYYYDAYYTYDENGRVTEIIIGESSVEARITPAYDENGNMISEHIIGNNYEFDIFYTYDDQNRLVEMRRSNRSYSDQDKYYYVWAYAYDDSGKLVEERAGYVYYGYMDYETVYAYTYDAEGKMIQEMEIYTDYEYASTNVYRTRTHVAQCITDGLGNVIQKDWTYGNTVNTDGSESKYDYVSATYYYTYGNVYFFDATGMESAE